MSVKQTLLITCDSPGCQASAQIELSNEAEANAMLKANKWIVTLDKQSDDGTVAHTCPWCAEAGIKNKVKS